MCHQVKLWFKQFSLHAKYFIKQAHTEMEILFQLYNSNASIMGIQKKHIFQHLNINQLGLMFRSYSELKPLFYFQSSHSNRFEATRKDQTL